MSALTNILVVGAALGGAYYFLEHKPAKERKKAKKKIAPVSCPEGQRVATDEERAQWGVDCLPLCPPGSQFDPETGECKAFAPSPGPKPSPGPAPLPGPPAPVAPPPYPGQVLRPETQEEGSALRDELENVPTVLIVPFAEGPVYHQRVLPIMQALAPNYPEFQFVVVPGSWYLGEMTSDVVMTDVGIVYEGQQEGLTIFYGAEPPPARERLAAANEQITPAFDAVDVDVSDSQNAINATVAALEDMLLRIQQIGGAEA